MERTSLVPILILESLNIQKYLQMTIQELCSCLKQEDPLEIKSVLEVILYKLFPEILSDGEKSNVAILQKCTVANLCVSSSNGTSCVLSKSKLESDLWRNNQSNRATRLCHIRVYYLRI